MRWLRYSAKGRKAYGVADDSPPEIDLSGNGNWLNRFALGNAR